MGAVEEGGKVASSVVEGLKQNPSCLAALAIVALFSVLQYFKEARNDERAQQRTAAIESLLTKCMETK